MCPGVRGFGLQKNMLFEKRLPVFGLCVYGFFFCAWGLTFGVKGLRVHFKFGS